MYLGYAHAFIEDYIYKYPMLLTKKVGIPINQPKRSAGIKIKIAPQYTLNCAYIYENSRQRLTFGWYSFALPDPLTSSATVHDLES